MIIDSILDTDLYKLTMQQAVCALYPWAEAQYVFINRGGTKFPAGFAARLQESVSALLDEEIRLSEDEWDYLEQACPFLTPVYLNYLSSYLFNPDEVTIAQQEGDLSIAIKGPWYRTILWEVPLMAMISELYFDDAARCSNSSRDELRELNVGKAKILKEHGVKFADFGTRRRYSRKNQDLVIGDLLSVDGSTLVGTSNVYLARKHGIKPIGTQAHEWDMYHGATSGYRAANRIALDAWMRVYQGSLGIALTDTYTTKAFFVDFDAVKARLFDGLRHDSGDPFSFADQAIDHYCKLGIDPTTKTIVFSDGLSVKKAVELQQHCTGKIRASFGIGTNLTNHVGVAPLNMVIKLSKCRAHPTHSWAPAVKLSDNEGKHTGDADEVDFCQRNIERMLR